MRTITCDRPANAGEENVLKRAAQLRDIAWTPRKPVPALYAESDGKNTQMLPIHLAPWRPVNGINYSAVRYKEKYIGTNVSLETYLSAVSFENSAMYNTSLHGKNRLSSAFYGCVCSQYVSYCLDFPFQIDCQQFGHLKGMHELDICDISGLDRLHLCDILNLETRHTAIITGIRRYEDGTVADITVSEATPPHIISGVFTPEVFQKHWFDQNFKVLRYDGLAEVTYKPDPFIPLPGDPAADAPVFNDSLLPDYGQKANYILGEPVVFTVFDGSDTVTIKENGKKAVSVQVENGSATFIPEHHGFYTAETKAARPVCFAVTDAHVSLEKQTYTTDEKPIPLFSNPAEDRFLGYVIKNMEYAKVWGYPASGVGPATEEKVLDPGEYLIISEYENEYGRYASHPCLFTVEKGE